MPKRRLFPCELDGSCEYGVLDWTAGFLKSIDGCHFCKIFPLIPLYIPFHLSCPVTSESMARATRGYDAGKIICALRRTSMGQVRSRWDKALIKLSPLQGQGPGLSRQPTTSWKSCSKFMMMRASCSCSKSQGGNLSYAPSSMSLWTACRGWMCLFFYLKQWCCNFNVENTSF